ncbi:Troponin C, isoform 1 [Folsomia candida]|uniref:Troponin C, isoform 1 n=1 Tax=Folsomia candida TaxID=158441 RepID=A0A226D307_FOLCA|nr:Troponin C, isoform 1 [Folsomia candida]
MADLDKEQIAILKKAFDTFAQGKDYITPDMVASIFRMMGTAFTTETLKETISEIDVDAFEFPFFPDFGFPGLLQEDKNLRGDRSGQIEFEEFTILAAKFIIEEDDEDVQKELKEAFRLYDKDGAGYISTSVLKQILHEIDDTLSETDLNGIIEEIDEDGSGTVDFDGKL